MINLRLLDSPETTHPDFEYARGMPKGSRTESNNTWVALEKKIEEGYFDFAICFWGAVGRITIPDAGSPGNVFYIKANKPWVREVFENTDWKGIVEEHSVSAGAPQLTNDEMIRAYKLYLS